jgi:isopropylmalate/homocitrate/citramalate synthase
MPEKYQESAQKYYFPEARKVIVASTTLRDGLQTSSASHVTIADRVRIAQMEEALGIDVCEAGFPGKENANSVAVIEAVAKKYKKNGNRGDVRK